MIELDAALIASQHEPKRWRKITELRLDTLACLAQLEQAQDDDLERLAVIARNQHNAAKKLNIARRKI